MTTITDSFFAPTRDMEVRNTAKKATWRSLLVSSSVHIIAFGLVVVLSQYSLDKRRDYIDAQPNQLPIKAALYIPPKKAEIVDTSTPLNDAEKPAPATADTSTENEQIKEIKQEPKEIQQPSTLPTPSDAEPPIPDSQAANANQRAGQFNFSPKDAATQYFDAYHNDRLAQEAVDAAREYQQQKTSPTIVDTRKGEPISNIPPRPIKRVNCSSALAKTFAVLSGVTGGTLQCTNLGDPNKFIDARVEKRPNEGR